VVAVGRHNFNQEDVYNEILKTKYNNSAFYDVDTFEIELKIPESGIIHVIYVIDLVQLE
jgi:hypothetical protein